MTGWLYTVVWLLIAAYLIFMTITRYRKPVMFILSGFVVFLAVWELINTLTAVDMKAGVYGWIYRGVAAVVLILCLVWYFWQRNHRE